MKLSCVALLALWALAAVSCSRDPNVVKVKYLQNGNRYFEKGKYKEAFIMYRNALKKDTKYSEAYYRVGLTELKMRKWPEAARDFRRAIDTDPKQQDARVQLGELYLTEYLAHGKGWEALPPLLEDLWKGLLKVNPRSAPALRLKGYLEMTSGNLPAAVASFTQANSITPFKPEIVLPLAQTLFVSNQAAEADKLARALIEKEKTFGPTYDLLYLQAMRNSQLAEGEAVLKLKIANNPTVTEYRIQLARHYYMTQRRPEMQQVLDKVGSKEFLNGRYRTGWFYLQIRDYDSAVRQFRAGVEEDTKNQSRYRIAVAETLAMQSKPAEAVRVLEEAIKADPKDDQAQALRSSLLIATGDPKQIQTVVADLQALIARSPANNPGLPRLRYDLGRALRAKRDVEQARTQFMEAAKLRKDFIEPRLALAHLHIDRRDWGLALQYAGEVIQLNPKHLEARLIRTNALAATQSLDQARVELDQILKEFPESPEAHIQTALLDMAAKQYKQAEATFLKLYQANPDDLRGLNGLTEVYAIQGQFGKAIDLLKAELAKHPDRLQMRVALGNLAVRTSQYDLALEHFRAVVKANPNAGDVYIRMGEVYRRQEKRKEAIDVFRKAIELRPSDPEPHLQLALLIDADGNQAEARTFYEQVLRLQPDHPVALNNMAYMMAETGGDLDRALTLVQQAKQKLPSDPNVADTLGWIFLKKNLPDTALPILRDLVAKQPGNPIYRYHFAMALYQRGDKPQAKKELLTALQNKPRQEQEAKIRALMAKL